MNEIISTTVLLFLIMDPLGNLPMFMSVLRYLEPKRRNMIIIREMLIALMLMLVFLFSGEHILSFLRLRTTTVSISGSIILFLIAIKMIFPLQESNNSNYLSSIEEPFLVPLAIPLVAGPSILAVLILLSHQYSQKTNQLVLALLVSWSLSLFILMLSNVFLRLLGHKGVSVLERLMGLLLIMIAIQMFLDGIRSYFFS